MPRSWAAGDHHDAVHGEREEQRGQSEKRDACGGAARAELVDRLAAQNPK
jgi:hypothetical protein